MSMSKIYEVAGTATEQKTTLVDKQFYNFTAVATYYAGSIAEGNEVTPSAGTIDVKGRIPGAGDLAAFNDSPLNCTVLSDFCDAGAPLVEVEVTPVGITGADFYVVTITGTEG